MDEVLEKKVKHNLSCFLNYYMQEYHLSRKDLSKLTGLSISTIKNYLDEDALPFPDALFLIQMSLHVDIIQIIGLSKNDELAKEKIHELRKIKEEINELMEQIINSTCMQIQNQSHTMIRYEPSVHQSLYQLPLPEIDPEKDFKNEVKNALRKNISNMIQEFVKENNMNYIDFAKMIGVHKSKITAYVKMNSTPALSTLLSMAEAMQVPLDLFFLSREDNETVQIFEAVREDLSLYYAFLTNKDYAKKHD